MTIKLGNSENLRVSNPRTVTGPDPGAAFPGAAFSGDTFDAANNYYKFEMLLYKNLYQC